MYMKNCRHLLVNCLQRLRLIMQTCPCNVYPLTPHFHKEKLGFTGDVASKVGDHVKIDEASPFFLVNLCKHQNKKNVMSTIMKPMIISSFLCIFAKY